MLKISGNCMLFEKGIIFLTSVMLYTGDGIVIPRLNHCKKIVYILLLLLDHD